ncbi:hypothetical protein GCM10027614_55160 [Micromonospora vulcania]
MVISSTRATTASPPERLAVLGRGPIPAGEPVLRADDLGVLRGDGLFETMHLREGRPWLRDQHLARLASAAAAVELDLPPTDTLVELLDTVQAGWPAEVEGRCGWSAPEARGPARRPPSTPR